MLPEIPINGKIITVLNIADIDIDYTYIVDNLRRHAGLKLYEVAFKAGVSYTRIQKASSGHGVRFSDCEKLALLDLHHTLCGDILFCEK